MTSTSSLIAELVRAANEVETPTKPAQLLRRAAAAICGYRELIAYSDAPANDISPGDIVHDLEEAASNIRRVPPDELSDLMLDAVETIKASQVLLKEKRNIENGPVRDA